MGEKSFMYCMQVQEWDKRGKEPQQERRERGREGGGDGLRERERKEVLGITGNSPDEHVWLYDTSEGKIVSSSCRWQLYHKMREKLSYAL